MSKLILTHEVSGLGSAGDVVDVKNGYARNYLLPRKLATEATADNLNAFRLKEKAKAAQIAPKLRAGLVTINSWSPDIAAPFGGYKQSGNGRETGRYGLADFMEVKTVVGAPA